MDEGASSLLLGAEPAGVVLARIGKRRRPVDILRPQCLLHIVPRKGKNMSRVTALPWGAGIGRTDLWTFQFQSPEFRCPTSQRGAQAPPASKIASNLFFNSSIGILTPT